MSGAAGTSQTVTLDVIPRLSNPFKKLTDSGPITGPAPRLSHVRDLAALTDDELAAGSEAWAAFDHPLPAWPTVDLTIPDATH